MQILICGLGLIGKQRIESILKSNLFENVFVYDPFIKFIPPNLNEKVKFINEIPNPSKMHFSHVIICTPHSEVMNILQKVSLHKPRILLEKPMGRNISEAKEIIKLTKDSELSVGFNYRFMDGIEKLKEILVRNDIGEVNSVRLDLGHGGSPEDANSWKLDKELAGGGSLLDPGIHLIDLILYLFNQTANSIKIDGANFWSGFWNTGIEESSFVLGRLGQTQFMFGSSIVAWRTRFCIEVIGTNGYVIVNGRGRSDGPQSITIGQRWGWQQGKSQFEGEDYSIVMQKDSSIARETDAWINKSAQVCSAKEALESMQLYTNILSKGISHEI